VKRFLILGIVVSLLAVSCGLKTAPVPPVQPKQAQEKGADN